MTEYPSNSKAHQNPEPSKPKVEPVVSGKIIHKKTGVGRKFMHTFFSGTAKGALETVTMNVLIPSLQGMFLQALVRGAETMLHGGPTTGNYKPTSASSWTVTPYNSMFSGNAVQKPHQPQLSHQAKAAHDFGEIIFENRVDAERVVNGMYDLLNQYELVSVADFYSLAGYTSDYTDHNYGWTDLRGTDIRRVAQGHLIILPKPSPIKK